MQTMELKIKNIKINCQLIKNIEFNQYLMIIN